MLTLRDLLNVVASVEIINGNLIIGVIIQRKKREYLCKNKDFICYSSHWI